MQVLLRSDPGPRLFNRSEQIVVDIVILIIQYIITEVAVGFTRRGALKQDCYTWP